MGLEEARRLRRLELEKEKHKLAPSPRKTRSQSQNLDRESETEMDMNSLTAQKILLIGTPPELTPYVKNTSVSEDTNLILQKLHEEKMERMQSEYKQKKQMVEYFEAVMMEKIEKSKIECLTTIAELDDEITGPTGKISLEVAKGTTQLKKEMAQVWNAISDLRIANTNKGVSSEEVVEDITKKVSDKLKDQLKSSTTGPRGKMAPRQRAEILKDNYLRTKSSREIVIRGIKNNVSVEPIEIARNAIEENVNQAAFDRTQIVAAQWKGKDVEVAKRDTLVVLFDNEANRQYTYENLGEECKKRTASIFFRQGMCPADLKRFKELHEKFDEFQKAGKLVQGAKCSIKGSNGHYYLPKRIFKNAEDSEETEDQSAETDNENKNDSSRPQKAKNTRKSNTKGQKQKP